jgi:hypothetical protein
MKKEIAQLLIPVPHRGRGRITHLPKMVRDRINQMLQDGLTYAEIAKRITAEGQCVSKWTVGNWRRSGHQEWLREQERLEIMSRAREFAIKAAQAEEGAGVYQAGLLQASAQIYELLTNFNTEVLRKKMDDDPAEFNRLVNTLARLADQGLKYERYRAEVAERKANIQKRLASTKPGGISDETREWIEHELKLM